MRTLILLFALSSPAVAVADSAAVFSRGPQATAPERASLIMLIRSALTELGYSECLDRKGLTAPKTAQLKRLLADKGCDRLFMVEVIPLGQKRVVQLTELSASAPEKSLHSVRMSAARVEEFDVLAPRLAKAVLTRRDARTTAQVDQVTEREGRDWRKRDGELLVGASIPVGISAHAEAAASYGIGGLLSYEMERARLDAAFLGQFNSSGDELWHGGLTLGAAYLFNAGNISPYVGASLGYGATWMGSDVDDADFGLLTSVGGGVEFFRLYRARMLIDARVTVPTYQLGDRRYPIFTGMFGVMLALR